MAKEPFWGPNAKAVFFQLVLGAAVALLVTHFLWQPIYDWDDPLSRWLINDTSLCEWVTC